MSFSLILPRKIVFGRGSVDSIGEEARALGASRALVITSPGMPGRASLGRLTAAVEKAGLAAEVEARVTPEPEMELVEACAKAARKVGADLVIGVGGGSVMDVAKKTALELSLPKVMVPTTAGTGSEVTHESVLKVDGKKKAFVDAALTPDVAIVDPDMGQTMPRALVAGSGMDALAHAVECHEARRSNPVSRALSLEAYNLIRENLRPAVGGSAEAMGNMSLGSLTSGMAFGNAGTTLGHALSYPLSNRGVPHGQAIAIVLPHALEFNRADPDLIEQVQVLAAVVSPRWDHAWDIREMVAEVMTDDRHLSNNPIEVTEADVLRIFQRIEDEA